MFKLLPCLLLLSAAVAQDDPVSWIDREGVRAAYHYGRPPIDERMANLKRVGINTLILKCPVETAVPWSIAAKRDGLKCFFATNFNVKAEDEGLRPAVLSTGVVEAYVCPLDEQFWREHLRNRIMAAVEESTKPDREVTGLWIDFELYSTRTGVRYYTQACYCDHCFELFCRHKQVATPTLEAAARAPWLAEQGWADEYQPFLQTRIEAFATELRETVHAANPNFLLGFYPTPRNWSLVGVARGFSTERLPILLWATDTYGGGGASRVPDDWRQHYAGLGITARYLAGLLLRSYSARNLATHLYQVTEKSDGYWLFTTYTLAIRKGDGQGDYYLWDGTVEEYWEAIRRANEAITQRRAEGPTYRTDLKLVPEPIPFRQLVSTDRKVELTRLIPPAATGQVTYDEVRLRGGNLFLVQGTAGRPLRIGVKYHPVGNSTDPLGWQFRGLAGEEYAQGEIPAADGAGTIVWTPPADGLYPLLLSAGGSAYQVTDSDAPLALHARDGVHLFGGPSTLYLQVPAGLPELAVTGKGSGTREMVKVELTDPAGQLAAAGETAPEEPLRTVTVAAPAAGLWRITAGRASQGILEDRQLIVPPPLPPLLSLSPEHVFGYAPE